MARRTTRRLRLVWEFFRKHHVRRKTLGDHLSTQPLDLEVHFRDDIDRTFLINTEIGPLPGKLNLSSTHRNLDGCLKKRGVD